MRLSKIDFDVSLDHANLGVRLALDNINQKVPARIVDLDRITLEETTVVRELLLEDGLGIGEIDEVRLVRLQHNELALLQIHVSQNNLRTIFDKEIVHHPHWKVDRSLFGREL